jgi:hypothetical protein
VLALNLKEKAGAIHGREEYYRQFTVLPLEGKTWEECFGVGGCSPCIYFFGCGVSQCLFDCCSSPVFSSPH